MIPGNLVSHKMWAQLMQLSCSILLSLALYVATAQACTTKAVYTDCPSAMDAAQFLTSNNSMLPISNASWSPSCPRVVSGNSYFPYVKITDFKECHYLASSMPQGALVLSNGNARVAADVVNTNTSANTKLGITQVDGELKGESDVRYPGAVLYDTVKLMFDITPTVSGPLRFQYVFGSEEYPKYAPGGTGAQAGEFNDVFAFFISPATPSNNPTNIALLPGTNTTVSIGSVNPLNSTFYVANHPSSSSSPHATALNGMTQLLNTSTYFITAGATYRIKLAIADMADNQLDSLVWVKAGSLTFASPPIVDCIGSYTSWSPCSLTCGGGNQSRTYIITRAAANGGAACPVANGTVEFQSCDTAPCPVDCIGAFSNWGTCSAACGGGSQNRTYMIQAAAANGGQACNHTNGTVQTQSCNTASCPVTCVGSYSAWSSCNETCGGGWQQQTYVITTPAANGGAACPEPHGKINLQQCNTQPCAPASSPGTSPSPGSPQPPSPSPSDVPIGSPDASPAGSPDAPQALSPDVSPAGSPGAPQALSPDASPAGSPGAPQALSPDISPAGSPDAPQALSPESVSPSIPPPAAGAGSQSPAASSPLVSQTSPGPPPAPTQSPSSSAAPPLAPTPSVLSSSSPALPIAPPSPPATQPLKPTPPSSPASTVFDNIPYIDSPPVLPPLPPISDSNITIRGGNVSITGVKIEGVGASIRNDSIPSSQASGNTPPQKKLTLRWAAFNGSLGFYTLGVDIEVYGEFTLHRTMNWTWDSAWKAWTTEVSIIGKFLLTRDEEVDGVVMSTTRLEPSVAGQLTLFSAVYPGPGFSGKYDWAGHLDMDPDPFAFWGINTLKTANRFNTVSPLQRSLLQSNTGNTPVQGRVSVREVNSKEAPTLNDLGLEAGSQVAIDEDIAVIVPPPDSNYWSLHPPGNKVNPPVKGNKLQGVILVLAAIVAPSAVAVCIVAVAGAVIYRRKKRKEQQQQKEREKEAETCEQTTGSEVGISTSSGGATAASTRSRRSRRRTSPPGQAVRQDASPAALEFSSPGADSQQPEVDPSATLQEGATPLSQVEFLDVNEAGQSMSFTSYPNLRRPAPKHLPGTREEAEQEANGGLSRGKHKGRFGSLTGSVAGMASSIAGAISNFRSSQSGQSYLYTGRDSPLPGMSSGAGGNRSVTGSAASFNLLGANGHPGGLRLDSYNREAAGTAQSVGHPADLKSAATFRTAKHMQQSVPAQWALPQLDPVVQTRTATWATGVAASWASDLKALSRGHTPPTAAPDEGSPANDIRDEVVTGGSTFLLPSRTRGFSPTGLGRKA